MSNVANVSEFEFCLKKLIFRTVRIERGWENTGEETIITCL